MPEVPDYQSFMRPLLEYGADGQEKNLKDAILALADRFSLAPEDRERLLPSGKQTILSNRVHWARTYLDKAGALRRTKRSHFVVTDRGRQLLAENPGKIGVKVLRQFPEFVDFQAPKAGTADQGIGAELTLVGPVEEAMATPEETMQAAEEAIASTLRTQLLNRIQELSPTFFERLVVDLIVAMGYGGTRRSVAQRLGKSGDEGIDGIVNEDPLGLDVVYIQAKRYAPENTIGRERIQQFAGALVGQGATKGVFVTTSSFSKGAVEYAQRVPQRIILIDGAELSRLMIQYDVGVRRERTIEIKRIDLDYFEETDG
ncbi:restriction endonuclease [Chthonobacter rhizosphaerae]|uniref:restriction endonuclease n=1 Tax=Chthonobacter rhizosphaerae TaxID=2735553 RepID=UPI0015EEA59F|nr:restriction endonuclease [Chthonobacter rhizosphaerae]